MNLTEARARTAAIKQGLESGENVAEWLESHEKLQAEFVEHVVSAVEIKTSTKSLAAIAAEIKNLNDFVEEWGLE